VIQLHQFKPAGQSAGDVTPLALSTESVQTGCSSIRWHIARLRVAVLVTAGRGDYGGLTYPDKMESPLPASAIAWSVPVSTTENPVLSPSPFTTSGPGWPGASLVTIATCTADGSAPSERP
jgi:hypothetical protein